MIWGPWVKQRNLCRFCELTHMSNTLVRFKLMLGLGLKNSISNFAPLRLDLHLHLGRNQGFSRQLRLLCIALGLQLVSVSSFAIDLERILPSDALRSGSTFISEDLKSLQRSDDLNPAFLWVIQGEALWRKSESSNSPNFSTSSNSPISPISKHAGEAPSCASCHGESNQSMRGVSTRYPQIDKQSSELINLEGRINLCRTRYQHLAPLALESDEILGLTAFVAMASRGLPMSVRIDSTNAEHYRRGRSLYYTRMGQINLACTHCHEQNWGRKLQGETISQGHTNDYPAYRLEWQRVGSLHRRLRACLSGVRAYMFPLGSSELLDLELFLAWRESDAKITVETPGVRR